MNLIQGLYTVAILLLLANMQAQDQMLEDYIIPFEITPEKQEVVSVINNSSPSIPHALILVGKASDIRTIFRECVAWLNFPNRTYTIDAQVHDSQYIRRAVEEIVQSQYLLFADIYFLQLHSEFEGLTTIPTQFGCEQEGVLLRITDSDICKTLEQLEWK